MGEEVRQRLFAAVGMAETAREDLRSAVAPLRAAYPMLRWTDPATWHLTLAFVGSVPVERGADVDRAVATAVAGRERLTVGLSGAVGTFGRMVLYAGVEGPPALAALAEAVAERLRAAGFAMEERPFVPHCTLARAPRGGRLPADLGAGFAGPTTVWEVAQVEVMRSRLQVGGAAHELRSAHRLGTPPS